MKLTNNFLKLLLLITLLNSCSSSNKQFTDNKGNGDNIFSYLNSLSVDTFSYNSENYLGVIYIFSRSINDSNFIYLCPAQCIYNVNDSCDMFTYENKVFIKKGTSSIFNSLVNTDSLKQNNNVKYRFCNSIGAPYIYDPEESILLYIDKNKTISKISSSENLISKIIFGSELPPATK